MAITKITNFCTKQSISDIYSNSSTTTTTIATEFDDIYTYNFNLPFLVDSAPGKPKMKYDANLEKTEDKRITLPVSYISLRDLIKLINTIILNSTQIPIPLYVFNGFDEAGNILDTEICNADLDKTIKQTGPSNYQKFAFTTQTNGFGFLALLFNIGDELDPKISWSARSVVNLADLVLFNVNYLYTTIQNILGNDTNLTSKKITSFLSNLFRELNTCTGGWISLIVTDSPIDPITHKSKYILILNENYTPTTKDLDLQPPLMLKAFTKGSVVRDLSVEASVPDAIQAEVATYTRAGVNYVGSGDTPEEATLSLAELNKSLDDLNSVFMDNNNPSDNNLVSSLEKWQDQVQGIYRKMFTITQGQTLAGKKISNYNLGNLGTAIFPIKLKVTLDGIQGFQYGNSITSNWLPKQYMIDNVYWTVIKIRHMIQNNDWSTELDTIYRINI